MAKVKTYATTIIIDDTIVARASSITKPTRYIGTPNVYTRDDPDATHTFVSARTDDPGGVVAEGNCSRDQIAMLKTAMENNLPKVVTLRSLGGEEVAFHGFITALENTHSTEDTDTFTIAIKFNGSPIKYRHGAIAPDKSSTPSPVARRVGEAIEEAER